MKLSDQPSTLIVVNHYRTHPVVVTSLHGFHFPIYLNEEFFKCSITSSLAIHTRNCEMKCMFFENFIKLSTWSMCTQNVD